MSLVYVGVAVAVIGAGISAYSASEQADAQKKQLNYQAKVDANNAKIADWQRSDALQRGESDAQANMRQQAQLIGAQRATLAANGTDLNQGSSLDLLASTKFTGAADVNQIQNNAAREAWGFTVDAANTRASQNLTQWQANSINPTKVGVMTGVGSLLTSASSYAGKKKAA